MPSLRGDPGDLRHDGGSQRVSAEFGYASGLNCRIMHHPASSFVHYHIFHILVLPVH